MQPQHTIALLMFENPKRNLSFWKPSIDPKGVLQPGGRHALNYLWLSACFGRTLAAVCTRSRSPAVHQSTSLLCLLHGPPHKESSSQDAHFAGAQGALRASLASTARASRVGPCVPFLVTCPPHPESSNASLPYKTYLLVKAGPIPTAPTSLPSRGTCKCRIVGHNLVLQRFQVEGSRQAGSNPLPDHEGRPL